MKTATAMPYLKTMLDKVIDEFNKVLIGSSNKRRCKLHKNPSVHVLEILNLHNYQQVHTNERNLSFHFRGG